MFAYTNTMGRLISAVNVGRALLIQPTVDKLPPTTK